MRLLCSCAFEIRVRKKSSGRSWTWFGVASQMVCPSVWPEIQSRSASEWISYEMAGSRRTQPRLPQRPSWIGLVLNGFQPEIARPWLQTVEQKVTCQSANALFLAGIRITHAEGAVKTAGFTWAKGDEKKGQNRLLGVNSRNRFWPEDVAHWPATLAEVTWQTVGHRPCRAPGYTPAGRELLPR